MDEKDIFDLLREESEKIETPPSPDSWQRLERKLTARNKRRRPRREVKLQLTAVAATLALLILVGGVSYWVARTHSSLIKSENEFKSLSFLAGHWESNNSERTKAHLAFVKVGTSQIYGEQKLSFEDSTTLSTTPLSIQRENNSIVLFFDNQKYTLQNIENQVFIFLSEGKKEIRLRQATADKFTLSFEGGMIFVFRKTP